MPARKSEILLYTVDYITLRFVNNHYNSLYINDTIFSYIKKDIPPFDKKICLYAIMMEKISTATLYFSFL